MNHPLAICFSGFVPINRIMKFMPLLWKNIRRYEIEKRAAGSFHALSLFSPGKNVPAVFTCITGLITASLQEILYLA